MAQGRRRLRPRPSKKKDEESFASKATSELIELSEKELQGRIIEPLLSSLGFDNVRDNAGPDEKGKDLVATKKAEFGRTRLYAIQIKKKKFTGRVDSPESLGSLFHQLIQARDELVIDPTTNVLRSPDNCVFITPYPIAPSVWERFHHLSEQLNKQNIEIIDGRTLLDLIRRHLPGVLELFSMEGRYRYQLERFLNRIPESTVAFSLQRELELSDIYIEASLDSSSRFFERVATRPAWLQGSKLLVITPSDRLTIDQLGSWFGCNAEIIDPPKVFLDREKKKLEELQKNISPKSNGRVVQISLDPLIKAVQTKARDALRRLAELESAKTDEARTSIGCYFIETRDRVSFFGDFNVLMDQWVSLVLHDEPDEWTKPVTRIPSSFLNGIKCNKYILGVPGAGKTTLLRNLARELSQSTSDALPIFLPLLLLREPTRHELVRSCIKQLQDQGYTLGDDNKGISKFSKKAADGSFHLFLDGLDEVGSNAGALLKVIADFAQEFPRVQIALSCRSTLDIQSFKGALELRLTPFTPEQLWEFVARWFNSQPSSANELRNWLESNDKITSAATNPLVAALLCSLFHLGAEMPTTEVELYERRFDLLLGKWEQAKGICPLNPDLAKRYWRFICALAFHMHERELRLISAQEATEIASSYYLDSYHGDPSGMINDCVIRGVLEYESLDGMSLGHLTYQEYLAARKIVADYDPQWVLDRVGYPWWKNVIRFYVSMKEDISPLIRLAVNSDCTTRVANELAELSELAPWTDVTLVNEIMEMTDYSDDNYNEFDLLVLRQLKKGVTVREAMSMAGKMVYGEKYDESLDKRSDAQALAYYDFVRHGTFLR